MWALRRELHHAVTSTNDNGSQYYAPSTFWAEPHEQSDGDLTVTVDLSRHAGGCQTIFHE